MPHQCVRCGTFYDDGATEILKGCKCGARLFFYVKKEKIEEAKKAQESVHLSVSEKQQMEKDIFEILGSYNNQCICLCSTGLNFSLKVSNPFVSDPPKLARFTPFSNAA